MMAISSSSTVVACHALYWDTMYPGKGYDVKCRNWSEAPMPQSVENREAGAMLSLLEISCYRHDQGE